MQKITVLVPVFNEEVNLRNLYSHLDALVSGRQIVTLSDGVKSEINMASFAWEFLFVNDGSSDRSLESLLDLRKKDPRINVINFSRNFGKETALLAGLDYSTGDAVIIMDADLQHPVSVIPEMIYWWQQGYDDVYGRRISRGKESWLRKSLSISFYKTLQKFSRYDILTNVGDFRLLSRRAVDSLISIRESQRYTKGLYCWIGYNKKAVDFEVAPREGGKTSFSYRSLFNLAIDGITSYTTSPLRLASVIGIIASGLAMIYLLIVLCQYIFFGEVVRGYPTLVCLILFLGGIQLLALGIIGEYIGRIFNEVKQRPPYIVESFNNEPMTNRPRCSEMSCEETEHK